MDATDDRQVGVSGGRKRRVASFGDSISVQYGEALEAALGDAFVVVRKDGLAEAMADLDLPRGSNLGNSNSALTFLKGLAEQGGPGFDAMLINCGLHDVIYREGQAGRAVSDEQYRENLGQILELAKGLAGQVFWVRTTPVHEANHNSESSGLRRFSRDVDRVNAIADEVCRERGVATIDLHGFTLSQGDLKETCPDGRHFSAAVQAAQGRYLAGLVRDAIN